MRLDRVAEDIYILISDMYLQVTSTVLLTQEGAIVIDAMPFPSEAREILAFVESNLGRGSVRYVINTHHHPDHVYGTYLFQGAEVIAHDKCRELLERLGQLNLDQAKRDTPALAEVELRLPDITFHKEMDIHLGHRHLHLFHTPGHTPDGISAYVFGTKALIAGDAVMPVPHIVTGDIDELKATLLSIKAIKPSFIVQGHGDVLLRGEVAETIDSSVSYLSTIVAEVSNLVQAGGPRQKLQQIDIESCGKSRIHLDGLVSDLHLANLEALYEQLSPT